MKTIEQVRQDIATDMAAANLLKVGKVKKGLKPLQERIKNRRKLLQYLETNPTREQVLAMREQVGKKVELISDAWKQHYEKQKHDYDKLTKADFTKAKKVFLKDVKKDIDEAKIYLNNLNYLLSNAN